MIVTLVHNLRNKYFPKFRQIIDDRDNKLIKQGKMAAKSGLVEVRVAAMDLLARREHSLQELSAKLERRFPAEQVAETVQTLAAEGLQSDVRFAEAFVRQRSQRGYGPIRIRQELRQRGISDALVAETMDSCEVDWYAALEGVLERKYGGRPAEDLKEKARRQRFLLYRGFAGDQIRDVLD